MLMELCNKYYLNCFDPILSAFDILLFTAINALLSYTQVLYHYMKSKITIVSLL